MSLIQKPLRYLKAKTPFYLTQGDYYEYNTLYKGEYQKGNNDKILCYSRNGKIKKLLPAGTIVLVKESDNFSITRKTLKNNKWTEKTIYKSLSFQEARDVIIDLIRKQEDKYTGSTIRDFNRSNLGFLVINTKTNQPYQEYYIENEFSK